MLPADPWELAVAEQPYFLVHDIWEVRYELLADNRYMN
jgi:hypothetical protein